MVLGINWDETSCLYTYFINEYQKEKDKIDSHNHEKEITEKNLTQLKNGKAKTAHQEVRIFFVLSLEKRMLDGRASLVDLIFCMVHLKLMMAII